MLVIRVNIEKSKENYQAVVAALADYDLDSVAWENEVKTAAPAATSGKTGEDLAANLSRAVNTVAKRQQG